MKTKPFMKISVPFTRMAVLTGYIMIWNLITVQSLLAADGVVTYHGNGRCSRGRDLS
jgi:hypothetical protein